MSPFPLEPLLLSLSVSVVGTLAAALVGIVVAGLISRRVLPGGDLIEALVAAPMVLPPTVLGYFLLVTLGRESALGRVFETVTGGPLVFTKTAAVLAAFLGALPFIVKSSRAAIDDVDPRLIGAASTLGRSPLFVFVTIVLPQSQSGILAGVTLGFARALGDFGVTLMIAGNIPGLTQTGALAIYDAVLSGRDSEAAGMSLVMAAVGIGALMLGQRLARRRRHAW